MKIGLFGGSFDPPHLGHLILAEQCLTQAKLDRILFIPAYQAPHKKSATKQHHTSASHRLAMLQLTIQENPAFQMHLCEIQRKGTSYTYDTICQLEHEFPKDLLFFLIGADSLIDLPQWYRSNDLLEKISFITVNREHYVEADFLKSLTRFNPSQQERLLAQRISIPTIGISSSQIRKYLQSGFSIKYFVPSKVEQYIHEHRLYL